VLAELPFLDADEPTRIFVDLAPPDADCALGVTAGTTA
jgi:hypothetical protein